MKRGTLSHGPERDAYERLTVVCSRERASLL